MCMCLHFAVHMYGYSFQILFHYRLLQDVEWRSLRYIVGPCHLLFIWWFLTKLCLTLETPWTVARQASLFMGFSRQEYWSGLPFPSPGDLPNTGIEPKSPSLASTDSFPLGRLGSTAE